MESSIARGKAIGKYKYWYIINDEGYHVPDGKNFELMKQAFHMKLYEEKTNESIWKWLISRGFEKANKKKIDWKNFSRIWKDPFYYGLYINGNASSDLNISNPYFRPLISEEEYTILVERLNNDTNWKAKDTRNENEEVNPIPKGLIKTTDWKILSHDFPNKNTRHKPNLDKLKKTNLSATYADVVLPKHIWYKTTKVKDRNWKQLIVNYADIEKLILWLLESMTISPDKYELYQNYMKDAYEQEQLLKAEKIHVIENQRRLIQWKLNEYVKKNLWNARSALEEKVYQTWLKEKQDSIDLLDEELLNLKNDERNYIAEFTVFMWVFQNMASRFKKLNYVRKREFIKIFVSNIEISRSRKITITTFPYIDALFERKISKTKNNHPKAVIFGADDETRTRNQLLGRQWL